MAQQIHIDAAGPKNGHDPRITVWTLPTCVLSYTGCAFLGEQWPLRRFVALSSPFL